MATVTPKFGTATALTVTNLHSLADAAAWQSAEVDNSSVGSDAAEFEIAVRLDSTTTAGDANGYADVYVAEAADGGTDYSGEASGAEGSYAPNPSLADQLKNLRFLGRIAMDTSETTARSFQKQFKYLQAAEWFAVIIVNESGAALASSANLVEVQAKQSESA